MVKNWKIGQKLKNWTKIEKLDKNWKIREKLKNRWKSGKNLYIKKKLEIGNNLKIAKKLVTFGKIGKKYVKIGKKLKNVKICEKLIIFF